ncbi:MAG: alpha-ketoacid dehydrogenase subunit beta [Bacillota bacterium]
MEQITYGQAVRDAMREELQRDENVFLMGEDIGVYGGAFGITFGMIDEFGSDRVRDTPISEAAIVGAGVGAAMVGMRPIVEIMFSDFLTLASDQIMNQAAKIHYMLGGKANVPLVVRTPGGSGTGAAAQHSQSLEALFAHIPGLKVVMPSSPYDVKGLLKTAIRDDNPVVFFEHKLLYSKKGEVPDTDYTVPFGEAEIKKSGSDITIFATSIMVHRVLEAAEQLANENISVEIIDPKTLVPLDTETIIKSVIKTGRLMIVQEACKRGGFASEVAAEVIESEAFGYLDEPIRRLAGKNIPIPYSKYLEAAAVPQVEDIVEAVGYNK